MKKNILLLSVTVCILLSACVKDAADEGVTPDFIPHFNYGGYTYYVHPSLGKMTWGDANKACKNLKAYGYKDWFLPSQGEIEAAPSLFGDNVWSSTPNDGYYYYTDYDYYHGLEWYSGNKSSMCKVVPVRKQATLSGK